MITSKRFKWIGGLALLLALGSLFPLLSAATWTLRHTMKLSYDAGGKRIPHWSNGSLVALESDGIAAPAFLTFDREGVQVATSVLSIPGASAIHVFDWRRGADGRLAACGTADDREGRRGPFMATMSPSGEDLRVIRVSPFFPGLVTVDSDGVSGRSGGRL
ncbi:MAG: hypothetical protein ABSH32_01215 [Bryobacteraceae bacterium]